MSKKGGKGVLKRLFSKDDNPEASSSAGGTATEKKKKKVRVGGHRLSLSDLLTFFYCSERIGEWPQSPFSPMNAFNICSNDPWCVCFQHCCESGDPLLHTIRIRSPPIGRMTRVMSIYLLLWSPNFGDPRTLLWKSRTPHLPLIAITIHSLSPLTAILVLFLPQYSHSRCN
jgi:hypothetical protein